MACRGCVEPIRNAVAFYEERVYGSTSTTGPYIAIKVPHPIPGRAARRGKTNRQGYWVRKAAWVWAQTHGPIPAGHRIIHRDGDFRNCEPDNIECVPKDVVTRMNVPSAPKYAGPDAEPARIALAKLRAAIATSRAS